MSLPTDAKARKGIPIYSGFMAYFPDAIAAVAELSMIGNDQHSPGEPLHWNKEKSADELDAAARHMLDMTSTERDDDNVLHATKHAWRALANLQRIADSGVNVLAGNTAISRDLTEQSAEEHVWPDTWLGVSWSEAIIERQSCLRCRIERCRRVEVVNGVRYAEKPTNHTGPCSAK